MTTYPSRIQRLAHLPPSLLVPHPDNWRTHPQRQTDALRTMLGRIGIADAIIVRPHPDEDGHYQIIDGHLRTGIFSTNDEPIPALVVDLDDSETRQLLVSLDPLSALADAETSTLEALLDHLAETAHIPPIDYSALYDLDPVPRFDEVPEDDQGPLDHSKEAQCPECGHRFVA